MGLPPVEVMVHFGQEGTDPVLRSHVAIGDNDAGACDGDRSEGALEDICAWTGEDVELKQRP